MWEAHFIKVCTQRILFFIILKGIHLNNTQSKQTLFLFIKQTKETTALLNLFNLRTKLYLKNTNIKNETQNATFLLFWALKGTWEHPAHPNNLPYESCNISDL